MAKTEMFLSPVGQGFVYYVLLGLLLVKLGQKAEGLVRQLSKVNKEYWNFHTLLDPAYIKNIGAAC